MIPLVARQHLAQDPLLAPLLEKITVEGRPDFGGDVYFGLIRSIAYQQLSGKAAGTIFGRFLELFPDHYPEPERLLSFSEADLRAVGLSRGKANYMQNVAAYFQEEKLFSVDWDSMDDDTIIQKLTPIKGIGKWTVEMVLMFLLGREDVLPLDDLVVRNRMVDLLGLEELKGRAQTRALMEAAEKWRPYRSWASRLMYAWEHARRKAKT
ncbi:Fe-S cluster assembly protein HesB [Lewinellaceae bacterium SD302]|nr:Fe-S cluster assembly protein HesB [Lewinellaceae bacterium SD302]